MQQDILILIPLCAHNSSANLAETYAVPPSCANQHKLAILLKYHKCRAVEVRRRESLSNLQLLPDGEGALASYNLKFYESSRCASLYRDKVCNQPEVYADSLQNESGELLRSVLDRKSVV